MHKDAASLRQFRLKQTQQKNTQSSLIAVSPIDRLEQFELVSQNRNLYRRGTLVKLTNNETGVVRSVSDFGTIVVQVGIKLHYLSNDDVTII
jgi:hypothetical protein